MTLGQSDTASQAVHRATRFDSAGRQRERPSHEEHARSDHENNGEEARLDKIGQKRKHTEDEQEDEKGKAEDRKKPRQGFLHGFVETSRLPAQRLKRNVYKDGLTKEHKDQPQKHGDRPHCGAVKKPACGAGIDPMEICPHRQLAHYCNNEELPEIGSEKLPRPTEYLADAKVALRQRMNRRLGHRIAWLQPAAAQKPV